MCVHAGSSWRVRVSCDLEGANGEAKGAAALGGLAALSSDATAKAANKLPKSAVMVVEVHETVGA